MRTVRTLKVILEKAIEAYRRQLFLKKINKAYASFRKKPKAWAQAEEERVEWDATLGDGLEPDQAK